MLSHQVLHLHNVFWDEEDFQTLAWLEIVGQKLLISHGFTLTSSVLNNLFFMGASVATILGNVLN